MKSPSQLSNIFSVFRNKVNSSLELNLSCWAKSETLRLGCWLMSLPFREDAQYPHSNLVEEHSDHEPDLLVGAIGVAVENAVVVR